MLFTLRGCFALAEKKLHTYLTTAEVADILHVSPKTVTRWAREGKLPHSRTLGGHRRYPGEAIRELASELARSNDDVAAP
jgi:excisionase family DNA binding protein